MNNWEKLQTRNQFFPSLTLEASGHCCCCIKLCRKCFARLKAYARLSLCLETNPFRWEWAILHYRSRRNKSFHCLPSSWKTKALPALASLDLPVQTWGLKLLWGKSMHVAITRCQMLQCDRDTPNPILITDLAQAVISWSKSLNSSWKPIF